MNLRLVGTVALLGLGTSLSTAMPTYAAGAAPTCFGQSATIVGTANNDTLVGTPGADVIVGLGGHDTIRGGGGDDLICGGEGNDTLYGEAGNDKVAGEGGSNYLDGGEGNDTLQAGTGNLDVDTHYETGEDMRRLFGDLLHGGPGDDILQPRKHVKDPDLPKDHRIETLSFAGTAPVTVDLKTLVATGQGTDKIVPNGPGTLRDTALQVIGSDGNDVIRGQETDLGDAPDWSQGMDYWMRGDATIYPGKGDDRVLARGSSVAETEKYYMGAREWTAALPVANPAVSGNDRYDFSQSIQVMCVECGTGKDLIIGSPNADLIEPPASYHRATFRLGRGADEVHANGLPLPTFSMGAGRDTFDLTLNTRKAVSVNAGTGQIRRAGKVQGRVAGAEIFFTSLRGPLTFTGTRRAENLAGTARFVRARLGGGSDYLSIKASQAKGSAVLGGAGRDRAGVTYRGKLIRGIYRGVEKVRR